MAALVLEALLREHRQVFGVRAVPAPFEVQPIDMRLIVPRPALPDAGIDWLAGVLERHLSGPRVAATRRVPPEQT